MTPAPDPPADAPLLPDRFRAVAARHPDRIAVEVPPGDGRPAAAVSYAALDGGADALAAALPAAAPDDRVAVVLPRHDPRLHGAQLGVLRTGAAFLPLDPAFPDAHLAAALAEAAPIAAVADATGAARLARLAPGLRVIEARAAVGAATDIAATARAAAQRRPAALRRPIAPRDLAYVISTSGTTGRPKGVMVEHRSIAALVDGDAHAFGLTPEDRVALCSSPAYDSSIEEAWLAFAAGATLVVLDDATLRLGPDLVGWLVRQRITVLCPPPTLLRMMACPDPAAALPALRLLYVGGEPLPPDLAAAWARGRRLVNGYGPTECTVTCTRGDIAPGEAVTIGRAVPGSRAHVLAIDVPAAVTAVTAVTDDAAAAVAADDVAAADGSAAAGAAGPTARAPAVDRADAPVAGRHAAHTADDEVPTGVEGELAIGGLALARGYLGQPALTAARFVDHPRFGRLYRTGDRARRRPDGALEHLGRLDDQVKLRGHRIELGAVEAALAVQPGVRAAAVRIQGDGPAAVLAAHIVPARPSAPPDGRALAAALAAVLPSHMVPARYGLCAALPTGVGGKLDRRALPDLPAAPAAPAPDGGGPITAPGGAAATDDRERAVAAAFAAALGTAPPPRTADFFADLGGTSLSAVAVIVALRDGAAALPAGAARLGVRDLYAAPSAAALAARWRAVAAGGDASGAAAGVDLGAAAGSASAAAAGGNDPSATGQGATMAAVGFRPRWLTAVQMALLAGELWSAGVAGYAAVFVGLPWLIAALGLGTALAALPLLAVGARLVAVPLTVAFAVAVKRTLVGRDAPGRHPLWGAFHLRHWAVVRAAGWVPWRLIEGTAWQAAALRALGARIGRRVHLGRGVDLARGGWDLLSIGDDAALGRDARLEPVVFDAHGIAVGPVVVGAGATLAVRAGVGPGGRVGRGAVLGALAALAPGAAVPDGAVWDGVPAGPVAVTADDGIAAPNDRSRPWSELALHPAVHAAVVVGGRAIAEAAAGGLVLALVAAALRRAGVDGAAARAWLAAPTSLWAATAIAAALAVGAVVLGLVGRAAALRLAGPVRPGDVAAGSPAALRIAFKARSVEAAGRWLSGSMLWPVWLRAAGMRIGRGAEISTIIDTVPELVTVGAGSFFADGVYLAGPRHARGRVAVAATSLGRDTFLGNHSVIAAGHAWPDGLFVGVATAPDARAARPGSAWFGHPAMALPRRDVVAIDRRLTHEPGLGQWLTRALWESLRLALPAGPVLAGGAWLAAVAAAEARFGPVASALVAAPLAALGAAALPVAATIGLKWALLGRVAPGQHAFWSGWCGRWDFVYMAWSAWARPVLARLEGTLALNAVLRAFGQRIGRRVVLGPGSAQVVDPDMLAFGDDSVVCGHFQAHSFEDRVLKIDHIVVGPGATVAADAVVFYGADIGAGATVAPHGVVMKGERLPGGRSYDGSPVR